MSRRPRELRWSDVPPRSVPKHPYRDTVLVYGVLAALVVLIAWVTGGPVLKSVALAAGLFVAAVAWSWFRWHQRLSRQARQDPL
jgi:hypothetical protein